MSGEVPLSNEALLRTIPKGHFDAGLGVLNPQAFQPHKTADHGQLSVDRANLTTAEECFKRRLEKRPNTIGVLSVTTDEAAQFTLDAFSDPIVGENEAHAYVDFRPVLDDLDETLRLAEELADVAWARGWKHGPV